MKLERFCYNPCMTGGNNKITKLVNEIDRAIERHKDPHPALQHLLGGLSDQEIATALDIDPEHRQVVFAVLTPEQKLAVLNLVNPHTLRAIISHRSDHELIKLIEASPTSVSQKIVSVTERSRINQLVPKVLNEQKRHSLHTYVNYPQRSVGRIMQPEVPTVKDTWKIEAALKEAANFDVSNGSLYQVYVLSEGGVFKGTIPLVDLLRAASSKKVADTLIKKPPLISPTMSQNRAAQLFREYDLIEAPVVSDGHILGRVLVDDILDVIHQEFTEDVQKFAGITAEETLETSALTSSRRRLPWMIGNIFLDLLAVSIILPFEETIAAVTALAVLMPVVSDMGGNVGIQSLTVSIRALADNKPQWKLLVKELRKEIQVGLLNGVILGTIIGIIAFVGWQNPALGLIVMAALFLNTILASIVGGVIPIILRKLKKDPAMMSGAVLTTITDFFGFLVFLGLARMFLEYLL
jgi:magnesium transporter